MSPAVVSRSSAVLFETKNLVFRTVDWVRDLSFKPNSRRSPHHSWRLNTLTKVTV